MLTSLCILLFGLIIGFALGIWFCGGTENVDWDE